MTDFTSQQGADKQCTVQEAVNEELRSDLFPEVLTSGPTVELLGKETQVDNLLPFLGDLEITGNVAEVQSGPAVAQAAKLDVTSLQQANLKEPTPENAVLQYTPQEFLATKPEDLPRNSFLLFGSGSISPTEVNTQLISLRQEYEAKYGAKLDYAAEITSDGARLTVLVQTANDLKTAALLPPPDDKALAADNDGNTPREWPEQTANLDCSTAKENAFSSKMLGLNLNSRPEAIQDERNRLLYELPPDADFSRQDAIKKARAYGFDENLPTDVLKERFNATGARRWAEVLQMNTALPSSQQITDAQMAALAKVEDGLPREEAAAASAKLWTSWFAQYAGLENYDSYAPDLVKNFYSMKVQSQLAEDIGLEAGATEKEIYSHMERKALQVDPKLSDEEVEHIRQARQLHLADDTAADVLAKKVREAEAERLAMLNSCSPNEKDGGNPAPFQW